MVGKFNLKKQEATENEVLNSVCEYLSLKKHFFFRTNNTPIWQSDGHGNSFFRRMSKWSMKGIPDIILLDPNCGTFIGLECKTQKGIQSQEQKEFEKKAKACGAEYYLIRSLDDLIEVGI